MSSLIDSDVLVWLTRGHVGAARRLHALEHWRISAVTYMELAQGCRDQLFGLILTVGSHHLGGGR
jgi:predicted nucleic acid-binding protein